MTATQAQWASRHDWFLSSTMLADGSYKVVAMSKGSWERSKSFTSFHDLYIWANY